MTFIITMNKIKEELRIRREERKGQITKRKKVEAIINQKIPMLDILSKNGKMDYWRGGQKAVSSSTTKIVVDNLVNFGYFQFD